MIFHLFVSFVHLFIRLYSSLVYWLLCLALGIIPFFSLQGFAFVICRVLCKLCQVVPCYEAIWIRLSCIFVDILYCIGVWQYIITIFWDSLLQISTYWCWCWYMFGCKYLHIPHLGWGGSTQIGGEKFLWSCFIFRRFELDQTSYHFNAKHLQMLFMSDFHI